MLVNAIVQMYRYSDSDAGSPIQFCISEDFVGHYKLQVLFNFSVRYSICLALSLEDYTQKNLVTFINSLLLLFYLSPSFHFQE